MARRLSLRTRLVLGVTVLAAVGLLAADIATYTALRGFMLDRTDQSLEKLPLAEHGAAGACPRAGRPFPGARSGDHVEVRTAAGEVVCSVTVVESAADAASRPALPPEIDLGPPLASASARYLTVGALEGDERSGGLGLVDLSALTLQGESAEGPFGAWRGDEENEGLHHGVRAG